MEHYAVTEQFHRTAPAAVGELVDDLDQPPGQVGRGPIAALLGDLGIAGEIEEGDGRGPDRASSSQSGPCQGRLGPEHGHLQHVVLEVPAIQQDQRALQAGHHGRGDLVEVVPPGVVRVTLGGQLLLDVGVEQPHLGLGQPSQAVAELPGRPPAGPSPRPRNPPAPGQPSAAARRRRLGAPDPAGAWAAPKRRRGVRPGPVATRWRPPSPPGWWSAVWSAGGTPHLPSPGRRRRWQSAR